MTHHLRAGFDVGGTNARVHLFDADLNGLGGTQTRIRDTTAPGLVAETLTDLLLEACDQVNASPNHIEAIGLGLAGQLSLDARTVLNAPNLGWRDVDFVDLFSTALTDAIDSTPSIRLVNDLSAQLWGEFLFGAVEGIDDVLATYVGTGIGGALLCGGKLLTGASNNAGEIGHSKVVVGGRPCGCGERGCVEAYAGGVHLERRLADLLVDTNDRALQSITSDLGIDLRAADDLSPTHPAINEIWEEATDYLAIVIANACTLLNPASLLIGGGVLENCPNFRNITLQKTLPLVLATAREHLVVHEPTLAGLSGMLGAADLAMP